MQRKRIGILVATAAACLTLISHPVALADDTASTTQTITIIAPHAGESLDSSNIQISGTAPADALVNVVITDADTKEALVEHQEFGKVEGSVTSDQNGQWVFTPQQSVVPGSFSVQASYTTADNQVVSSAAVIFSVVTSGGSTHVFSAATVRRAIILGGLLVLFLSWLLVRLVRRRHVREAGTPSAQPSVLAKKGTPAKAPPASEAPPQPAPPAPDVPLVARTLQGAHYQENRAAKLKAFQQATFTIEDELAKTAEELERTNAQVVALRTRLSHDSETGHAEPPSDASKQNHKNKDSG